MTKEVESDKIAEEIKRRSLVPVNQILATPTCDVPRNMVLTYIVNIDECVASENCPELAALRRIRAELVSRVLVESIVEDAFAIATLKISPKPVTR